MVEWNPPDDRRKLIDAFVSLLSLPLRYPIIDWCLLFLSVLLLFRDSEDPTT